MHSKLQGKRNAALTPNDSSLGDGAHGLSSNRQRFAVLCLDERARLNALLSEALSRVHRPRRLQLLSLALELVRTLSMQQCIN